MPWKLEFFGIDFFLYWWRHYFFLICNCVDYGKGCIILAAGERYVIQISIEPFANWIEECFFKYLTWWLDDLINTVDVNGHSKKTLHQFIEHMWLYLRSVFISLFRFNTYKFAQIHRKSPVFRPKKTKWWNFLHCFQNWGFKFYCEIFKSPWLLTSGSIFEVILWSWWYTIAKIFMDIFTLSI